MSNRTYASMFFLVSLYPLLIAVFFGAVVIDIAYSRTLAASLPGRDALFRGVSDILLQIGFLVFVSGCAAILAAWRERQAQVLFLVSVIVFIAFGFLLPIAFMQQLGAAGMGSALGPTIRISVNLLAAALAIMGFYKYARSRQAPAY